VEFQTCFLTGNGRLSSFQNVETERLRSHQPNVRALSSGRAEQATPARACPRLAEGLGRGRGLPRVSAAPGAPYHRLPSHVTAADLQRGPAGAPLHGVAATAAHGTPGDGRSGSGYKAAQTVSEPHRWPRRRLRRLGVALSNLFAPAKYLALDHNSP